LRALTLLGKQASLKGRLAEEVQGRAQEKACHAAKLQEVARRCRAKVLCGAAA
jgi:hypothetical protein